MIDDRSDRRFSRRRILLGVAAGSVLGPFVPLLDREARGGSPLPFPTRIILLFSPNGTLHERWVPTGTIDDFTLGPILAPLEAYKAQLVVIDGLRVIHDGLGDPHQRGMGALWTGTGLRSGPFVGFNGGSAGYASGISVDQSIANTVGGESRYRSLELGVHTGGANVWTRMCYAGPDQPLAPADDPQATFERLFAELGIGMAGFARLKAERRSVLDFVTDDLAVLARQHGANDRIKLEAHLTAIRAMEQRNETATPRCDIPTLEFGLDPDANDSFPEVSRRQIDQLVMALACDLTRVASLQWSSASSIVRFTWLRQDVAHHDLSHLGDDDPAMVDQMTAINRWYAEEVKYLLDRLAAVPEGNGTLLDHTLVVWGNELSRGNSHGNHPVPFVLAGGANGRIAMGRYLRYDSIEHNRLLVSLCHYMGLDEQEAFGNDPSRGGLDGLL